MGTLLMTPEGELDETIHKLRPQNPLGIADLRQVNIDWSTLDDARKDIQSWVTKEVSGKELSQHVSATGKRVDRGPARRARDRAGGIPGAGRLPDGRKARRGPAVALAAACPVGAG